MGNTTRLVHFNDDLLHALTRILIEAYPANFRLHAPAGSKADTDWRAMMARFSQLCGMASSTHDFDYDIVMKESDIDLFGIVLTYCYKPSDNDAAQCRTQLRELLRLNNNERYTLHTFADIHAWAVAEAARLKTQATEELPSPPLLG
jgi:hypothetical protein